MVCGLASGRGDVLQLFSYVENDPSGETDSAEGVY